MHRSESTYVRSETEQAHGRARPGSGTPGACAVPMPKRTGKIPTRSNRRSRPSSRSFGRAGPGSTRRTRLKRRDRDQDLPRTRAAGRLIRTMRVPVVVRFAASPCWTASWGSQRRPGAQAPCTIDVAFESPERQHGAKGNKRGPCQFEPDRSIEHQNVAFTGGMNRPGFPGELVS